MCDRYVTRFLVGVVYGALDSLAEERIIWSLHLGFAEAMDVISRTPGLHVDVTAQMFHAI